jgi:hypothetical protein
MAWEERLLIWLLRVIGVSALFAIPFIIVPHSWMSAIHAWLGLGELPRGPIVSYLTRSLSLFYGVHGAVTVYLTFELRRYWDLLRFWALTNVILGATLLLIDLVSGLPLWWMLSEGPFAIAFGVIILGLQRLAESREGTSF